MSGTIPLSMTQQFDVYGQPLKGGQLYIIQAGTVSTPQNPYQDAALSLVMPNPITLDAAGRIPQFFLADGYIKIRLQDVNGVVQLAADGILVIGPSAGGGGGGGGVDATTVMATGDIKVRYDIAVLAGFVRANGRTIGSSASGASELADPSAQALFNYLWNKDTSLAVTPSRGASSAADWAANKQIALPDFRGYALSGLDDMGNVAAGRLSAAYWGGNPIVLGSVGGGEYIVQTIAQMASHYHSAGISDPGHGHNIPLYRNNGVTGGSTFVAYNAAAIDASGGSSQPTALTATAIATGIRVTSANGLDTTYNNGGGQPMRTIGPRKLITIYMKL